MKHTLLVSHLVVRTGGLFGRDVVGLVVRVGGALQTLFGGGETVEVPRNLIGEIEPDGVHLRPDPDGFRTLE